MALNQFPSLQLAPLQNRYASEEQACMDFHKQGNCNFLVFQNASLVVDRKPKNEVMMHNEMMI